jgi:hypothetical protein
VTPEVVRDVAKHGPATLFIVLVWWELREIAPELRRQSEVIAVVVDRCYSRQAND